MLVTVKGVTKSQPTIFVGYTSPVYDKDYNIIANVELSVTRVYQQLSNQWGGIGRTKALDADGKLFNSMSEAQQYALDHGYLTPFVRYNPIEKQRRKNHFWTYIAPTKGLNCPVE